MSVPNPQSENALLLRRQVDAPRALLWDYVSTSRGLSCWQADEVEGDLSRGEFSLRWPSLGARLDLSLGHYERGERIVLQAGTTQLDLRVGDGFIELAHHGLDLDDDWSGFESSWNTALALLQVAATRHPRRERRVSWLFQPVETSAELLHIYFTDVQALGSWLGVPDAPLQAGSTYEMGLFGGERLSGDVLHTDRDVCLHVSEWNHGALAMRSLPGPQQGRIAALAVSTWDQDAPRGVAASLEGALSRLSSTTQRRDS
jgi:hypothetical protein